MKNATKKMPNDRLRPQNPERRSFLYGAGAAAAACLLSGGVPALALPGVQRSPRDLNPQPTPAGPYTAFNVAVTNTVLSTISSSFAGLSYDKSHINTTLFQANDSTLVSLFAVLGQSSVLRICGASVETTVWTPDGPGRVSGQVSPVDIQNLAAFIQATGWKVVYGLALATSTPQDAAAEAVVASQAFGSSLLGFEIGNEPDNYVTKGYFPTGWGVNDYIALYQAAANAVQQAVPGAPIVGPAVGHTPTWTAQFAAAEVGKLTVLTEHYYRENGSNANATIATMLSYPDQNLIKTCQSLQSSSQVAGCPWAMGETNSFDGTPQAATSAAHAAALWSLDHLFTIAQYSAYGAWFHGGGNTPTGYGPIKDNGPGVTGVRPIFYGLYLFGAAGPGNLLSTTQSSTGLNVSAYAINTAKGCSVVLVNKDSSQTLSVTLQVPTNYANASLSLMTNPGGLAAISGTEIQGQQVNANGTFSPFAPYTLSVSDFQTTLYIPPASAGLVLFS